MADTDGILHSVDGAEVGSGPVAGAYVVAGVAVLTVTENVASDAEIVSVEASVRRSVCGEAGVVHGSTDAGLDEGLGKEW